MKSSIFYILCVLVSTGADLCSESIKAITQCVATECPDQTGASGCNVLGGGDNCNDVEIMCQEVVACCDNNCADSLEAVIINCVPGGVCEDITCNNGSNGTNTGTGGEGELCSESIKAVTQCVATECPDQTVAGQCQVLGGGDTCNDVEIMCQEVVACCDNNCADSLEALIDNCVPGSVCEDITCKNGAVVDSTSGASGVSSAMVAAMGMISATVLFSFAL